LYSIYDIGFKNPSFSFKIIYKKKKPFGLIAKGLEFTSSPYWKALELLRKIY